MDWLTFITKLVDSLAWPVAVAVIAFCFRGQILRLAETLRKVKWKGVEAEFGEVLSEAKSEADRGKLPPATEVKRLPAPGPEDRLEEIRQLALMSPPAAIIEAWRDVERAYRYLYNKRKGEETRSLMEMHRVMRDLLESDEIDLTLYETFERLRVLRNMAVHDRGPISPKEALQYAELAVRVVAVLIDLADKNKSQSGDKSS